jgi:hypothetical protein
MHGGDFTIDKKTYIYVLFFMVGIMLAVVVIETMKIPMNYVWIPFISSIFLSTVAILYTVEDVRLHEVVLAAVTSVIVSFMIGTFGAISGALLLFQGISSGLGFAATSVSGLAASLGLMGVAAVPTVVAAAAVASPISAIEAANIPLPRSRSNSLDDDWLVGGRHRRGGLRWRW